MNTGNNLLYLLVSMLLGLIIVSGILSEQSMRGLHFVPIAPDEIRAGREALLGVRVVNRKRWRSSYSIVIEVADPGRELPVAYLARLDPGAEQLVTWPTTFPRRGRARFPGLRVTTRFPFGLFIKAGTIELGVDLVIFPAMHPVAGARLRELASGGSPLRRRGRGSDLHNLREYRPGDDPRFIHWRSSAKAGLPTTGSGMAALLVREFEADTTMDVRIVLAGSGREAERLEAGLSEAASLASHLLGAGGGVELVAPAAAASLGRGRAHRTRVLTALALYDPAAAAPPSAGRASAAVREIQVAI